MFLSRSPRDLHLLLKLSHSSQGSQVQEDAESWGERDLPRADISVLIALRVRDPSEDLRRARIISLQAGGTQDLGRLVISAHCWAQSGTLGESPSYLPSEFNISQHQGQVPSKTRIPSNE